MTGGITIMDTEARSGLLAGLAVALLLAGCAATSPASDLGRVRRLTNVERLPSVRPSTVELSVNEDTQKLMREPLTPDSAVRIALLNNRELRATLREMGIARGQYVQAGLLPNPVFEAELLPERDTNVELRVEYDITHAVLAPLRRRAVEPELQAARYEAAAAVIETGYRARAAVYGLQAAAQRLALAQQMLDAQAASRDAAKALLEAGGVPALDAASQEAAFERARVRVAELELDVAMAREHVRRVLGLSGGDASFRLDVPLAAVPETLPAGAGLETRALRASFELSQMRHRLEGLARQASLTRTEGWLPDIAMDVHALQTKAEAGAPGDEDRWRYGAGVSLTVPLFDRRQGDVLVREAQFDALMERYVGAAIDLRSRVREAYARLASSHGRATQYQRIIVPAQARVTEQTLLQYNAMQVGVFQLLDAKRQQLDVEMAYVEALREYWSAAAAVDAALAGQLVTTVPPAWGDMQGESASRQGDH